MVVMSPAQYIVEMYGLDVCALSEYLDMYDRDAVSVMEEEPLTEEQAEKLSGLGRSKESWLAMDNDFQSARAAQ